MKNPFVASVSLTSLILSILDSNFNFHSNFKFATHSNFGAAREALEMDIVSTVVGVNGILR